MTIKKIPASLLLFLLGSTIAACSPYVYKEEVGKFQSGVEQSSKMLDSQKEFLEKRSLEITRNALIAKGSPRLQVSDKCIEAITCLRAIVFNTRLGKACPHQFIPADTTGRSPEVGNQDPYEIVYKAALDSCFLTEEGKGLKLENPAQLPALTEVVDALRDYASALAGIVDAKDKESLADSASKACSSTQQLFSAATSVEFGKSKISEETKTQQKERLDKESNAIASICGLVTQIGTGILDRRRLEVLSRVVSKGDKNVHVLATYLASESRYIYSLVLTNELEVLVDSTGATAGLKGKNKQYWASIDSAISEKNKLVEILKNNPAEVFLNMADAHQKLAEAVNDPKTQLQAAIESLGKFNKAAKDAHAAMKALLDSK
jgi:hypothetical protein